MSSATRPVPNYRGALSSDIKGLETGAASTTRTNFAWLNVAVTLLRTCTPKSYVPGARPEIVAENPELVRGSLKVSHSKIKTRWAKSILIGMYELVVGKQTRASMGPVGRDQSGPYACLLAYN